MAHQWNIAIAIQKSESKVDTLDELELLAYLFSRQEIHSATMVKKMKTKRDSLRLSRSSRFAE